MAFPTNETVITHPYGARKGTEMIVFHTTEGAGPSRQNALDTIKLQQPGGSLYAGGGSYNFVIYDGGVICTVGYLDISGSLSTDHRPPPLGHWAPKEWIKQSLSAAANADTNAYVLAVCFSGKAADLAAGRYPDNMIETAAKIILWAEAQPWCPDNVFVAGHVDFQTNRSDPGVGVVDKVLARYNLLKPAPDPAPVPSPVPAVPEPYAGQINAFGTRYPDYIHTAEQALSWVNRQIAALRAVGKI